ncbi:transcription termination factor 4, mitochondrial [Rhinophrynus dorsalis]
MVSRCLLHRYLSQPILCVRHLSIITGASKELLDLGFSEEQACKILSLKTRSGDPQHRLSCIKELLFIGLDTQTTLKILENNPELCKATAKELRDRTETLRSLGLGEGILQRSVSRCPSLLSLPRSQVLAAVQCLRQRCRFSAKQLSDILRSTPEALTQDPSSLEEAFQYVYFRMGGKQKDIITSGLFRTSLNEVRVRHQFLERLGRYQPPSKKVVSPLSNPKLKEVIMLPEEDFLSRIARASPEELHTFRKILAREEIEDEGDKTSTDSEDEEHSDIDRDSDDDGEDSGDEEDRKDVQREHTKTKKRRS